jgi:hypothetical protein
MILPHRSATHLDPVGVVNQAVEDAVGQREVADPRDRQLRGQDGRAHVLAILADLPKVAMLVVKCGFFTPVCRTGAGDLLFCQARIPVHFGGTFGEASRTAYERIGHGKTGNRRAKSSGVR